MKDCPNISCNGKVESKGSSFAYCVKCHYPVFACEKCGAFNRSLACYCRECGSKISFPCTSLNELNLGKKAFWRVRKITLGENSILAPRVYKGFLWFLARSGTVYAVSPYADKALSIGSLGREFGISPFLIAELPTEDDIRIPYLISIGRHVVRGLNLITGTPKELLTIDGQEEIVCDLEKAFCSIVEINDKLCFLKRSKGKNCLCIFDLTTNSQAESELDDGPVAGPIGVRKSILAYSETKLYLVDENIKTQQIEFPGGAKPCLSAGDFKGLHPARGSQPYMAADDCVYLQGYDKETTSPGFFYISLCGAVDSVSPVFIGMGTSKEKQVYTWSGSGNPVIVSDGVVRELSGSAIRKTHEHPSIKCEGVPFSAPPLTVAFSSGTVGNLIIKFFWNATNGAQSSSEYRVEGLGGFSDPVGFFLFPMALAMVYAEENENIGIAIWDL